MNDKTTENYNTKSSSPKSPNERKPPVVLVARRPTLDSILQQFPELSLFFELKENAQAPQESLEGGKSGSSKERGKFNIKKIFTKTSDKTPTFLKFPFGKPKDKPAAHKPQISIRDSITKAAISLTNSIEIIDLIQKKIQRDCSSIGKSIKDLPKKDNFYNNANHQQPGQKPNKKSNNKSTFLNRTTYRLKILFYLKHQESLKILKAHQLHCDKHKEYIQNLLEIINIVNQEFPTSDFVIHATLLNDSIMNIDKPILNFESPNEVNKLPNIQYMKQMKYIKDKSLKHNARKQAIKDKIWLLTNVSHMHQISEDLDKLFSISHLDNDNSIPKTPQSRPEAKKRKLSKKSDHNTCKSYSTNMLNLDDDHPIEKDQPHSDDNDILQRESQLEQQIPKPKQQQHLHRSNSIDVLFTKNRNDTQHESKINQKAIPAFDRRQTLISNNLVSEESTSNENGNFLASPGEFNSYFPKDRIFCDYDMLVHNEMNLSSSVSSVSSMIPSNDLFGDRFLISDEESSSLATTRLDHKSADQNSPVETMQNPQNIEIESAFEEEEDEAETELYENLATLDEIDLLFEEIQKYIVDKDGQFIIFEHLLETTEFVPLIPNPDRLSNVIRKIKRSPKETGLLISKLCQTFSEVYMNIFKEKQRQVEQQRRMEQAALQLTQQQQSSVIINQIEHIDEIEKNMVRFLFVNFSRHIFNDIYINEMHKEYSAHPNVLFENSIKRARLVNPKECETFQPTLKYLPSDLHEMNICAFTSQRSFHIYQKCVDDIVALQFEATPADFGYAVFKIIEKIQKIASDFLYTTKLEEEEEKFLRSLDQAKSTNSLGQPDISSFSSNLATSSTEDTSENGVNHSTSFDNVNISSSKAKTLPPQNVIDLSPSQFDSSSSSYVRKSKQQIRADCQLSCDDLLDIFTLLIVVAAPFELRQSIEFFAPYLSYMRLSSQLEFASITIQNVVNHIVQVFGTKKEITDDQKRLRAKIDREKFQQSRNKYKTYVLIP